MFTFSILKQARCFIIWISQDVTGGTFPLSLIGTAEDGAVYAGNLSTSAIFPNYKLYRWDNDAPETIPTLVFEGDPGLSDPDADNAQRWGDTMDVRGAGQNTQILLGSRAGNSGCRSHHDGWHFIRNSSY